MVVDKLGGAWFWQDCGMALFLSVLLAVASGNSHGRISRDDSHFLIHRVLSETYIPRNIKFKCNIMTISEYYTKPVHEDCAISF